MHHFDQGGTDEDSEENFLELYIPTYGTVVVLHLVLILMTAVP